MGPKHQRVVVFDLGGVLAEICHSWQDAAQTAGLKLALGDRPLPLTEFQGFDQYQAGVLSVEEYAHQLGEYLGCSPESALLVHNAIIVKENPGVEELVAELRKSGAQLGCLSNTNELHWQHLALNGAFPTIHSLESKMASHLVGLNKPDAAIYDAYCQTFGYQPEQIIFFDDSAANVAGAKESGWTAFQIDPEAKPAVQMRAFLACELN